MAHPIIAVQTCSLTKRFPRPDHPIAEIFLQKWAPPAVENVTLTIHEGELFGLLGPNGAGKTTLLKMLATLITPTFGEAWVNGHSLPHDEAVKAGIGLVTTDERSFYWRLTGRQNLNFFAHLHSIPSKEIPSRIEELFALTHLQSMADQPFRTYSTGMRQRLAIARALLHRPKILFLDEPTRGLDPPSIRALHHLIRHELTGQQGLTVLLTTHWLWEAEELCDRLAILHGGRIRACGTLAELRALLGARAQYRVRAGTFPLSIPEALAAYFPSPAAGDTQPVLTMPDDIVILNQVLDTLRAANIPVHTVEREELPLETIFNRFTSSPVAPTDSPPQHVQPSSRSPEPHSVRLPHFFRVAAAFIKRDWYVETSYRLAFLMDLVSIFFSVAVFYFVGELIGTQALPFLEEFGGDYFAFVLVGIAFSRYFGVGISSFANNLRQAQTTGTLEAMLVTPTSLSTIILSSSLWNFGFATVQVLAYLLLGWLFLGVQIGHANLLAAGLILGLSIVVFCSLGILAASFVMVLKRGDPITWFFNASFTLLGGVYYPITILPEWMQTLSNLLPVTYGLRAMRHALLQGAGLVALLPDLIPLTLFGIFLLPVSLLVFRKAVLRARQDGSLTHF